MAFPERKGEKLHILEEAANLMLTFCGFCGVYLLFAQMLYLEVSVTSMLPYLAGGAAAAYALRALERFIPSKLLRWIPLAAVCLIFLIWNFNGIVRGILVAADQVVYYFNYVFGTGGQFDVDLFFGNFQTTLGSGQAASDLGTREGGWILVGAQQRIYHLKTKANLETCLGAIAFYSALFKTRFGYRKEILVPDIAFGGGLLAVAFLVGGYETTWTIVCLLLYAVGLVLMLAQSRPKARRGGRTRKREHSLSVYNEHTTLIFPALLIAVCASLLIGIGLMERFGDSGNYDAPWIVEQWEQARGWVNASIWGNKGGLDDEAGDQTSPEETTAAEETTTSDVSWEPVTEEGQTTVSADSPDMDLILGTLALEDEMREGTDTTYLKVLIDPSYYNSAESLYLKCYAGEVYEGDSWSALPAEELGVTDSAYAAMNASLVVATYDLFSQYIRGTASDYLKKTLPGLFDIGTSGKIRIQYMGESSVLFVPYYAISVLGSEDYADASLRSGDGTTQYFYDLDHLLPDAGGASAGEIISYNAIAASFGDEFIYGDGLPDERIDTFKNYENGDHTFYSSFLPDEVYLYVPESLSRLREEFSTVEIGGKTYNLEDYDPDDGEAIVNEAGLGDCIGFVVSYLTENMTYSRSVSAVPDGADYIETFLFDRKTGYCSHYASAAVMMFRLLGIRARYAEGFAVELEDAVLTTTGQYLVNVTGQSAHAWVEIYVTGVGWVPVNVTYSNDTAQATEVERTSEISETMPSTTAVTPASETETTATETVTEDEQTGAESGITLSEILKSIGTFLRGMISVLRVPFILLLLFELIRLAVGLVRSLRLRWRSRGKTEEERLLVYAADLERYIDRHLYIKKRHIMKQADLAAAEKDLFERADGGAGETLTAEQYENLLGLIRYAGKKLSADECTALYATMRRVKRVIYRESRWRRKVFFW